MAQTDKDGTISLARSYISMDENREKGLEILRQAAQALGSDPIEELFALGAAVPGSWSQRPPAEGLDYVRTRLDMPQLELARRSGVAQSQISRLLCGGDALLSTWMRLYEAIGFKLVLVPIAVCPWEQLRTSIEAELPPRRKLWLLRTKTAGQKRM